MRNFIRFFSTNLSLLGSFSSAVSNRPLTTDDCRRLSLLTSIIFNYSCRLSIVEKRLLKSNHRSEQPQPSLVIVIAIAQHTHHIYPPRGGNNGHFAWTAHDTLAHGQSIHLVRCSCLLNALVSRSCARAIDR